MKAKNALLSMLISLCFVVAGISPALALVADPGERVYDTEFNSSGTKFVYYFLEAANLDDGELGVAYLAFVDWSSNTRWQGSVDAYCQNGVFSLTETRSSSAVRPPTIPVYCPNAAPVRFGIGNVDVF